LGDVGKKKCLDLRDQGFDVEGSGRRRSGEAGVGEPSKGATEEAVLTVSVLRIRRLTGRAVPGTRGVAGQDLELQGEE